MKSAANVTLSASGGLGQVKLYPGLQIVKGCSTGILACGICARHKAQKSLRPHKSSTSWPKNSTEELYFATDLQPFLPPRKVTFMSGTVQTLSQAVLDFIPSEWLDFHSFGAVTRWH